MDSYAVLGNKQVDYKLPKGSSRFYMVLRIGSTPFPKDLSLPVSRRKPTSTRKRWSTAPRGQPHPYSCCRGLGVHSGAAVLTPIRPALLSSLPAHSRQDSHDPRLRREATAGLVSWQPNTVTRDGKLRATQAPFITRTIIAAHDHVQSPLPLLKTEWKAEQNG